MLEEGERSGLELDGDFRAALWQALAVPQIKRHARPAPIVHKEARRNKSLSAGVGRHTLFLMIAGHGLAEDSTRPVLPPYHVLHHLRRGERLDSPQDLGLFVA